MDALFGLLDSSDVRLTISSNLWPDNKYTFEVFLSAPTIASTVSNDSSVAQTEPSDGRPDVSSEHSSATDDYTEYNVLIYESQYVAITLVSLYHDHMAFTVESKMKNNNIDVYLETVALDGLVSPETYSETSWQEVKPGETLDFQINTALNYTDHKYLSASFEIFDDTGTGVESISISNFDIGDKIWPPAQGASKSGNCSKNLLQGGGTENTEFEEPDEILAYDSSTLTIYYVGAEGNGIRLRPF